MKNVLINNGSLGRQGKTTIAFTLWQKMQNYTYVTNDLSNASAPLQKLVPGAKLICVNANENIHIDAETQAPFIFDFGGKPDHRLLDVAKYVDLIIVPIHFQSANELKLTISNINAFREVNSNIVIVTTQTDPEEVKFIRKALAVHDELNFPIYEIAHSKYIRRLANEGLSVFDVAEANKADNTRLSKKVIPQFNTLIDLVKGN